MVGQILKKIGSAKPVKKKISEIGEKIKKSLEAKGFDKAPGKTKKDGSPDLRDPANKEFFKQKKIADSKVRRNAVIGTGGTIVGLGAAGYGGTKAYKALVGDDKKPGTVSAATTGKSEQKTTQTKQEKTATNKGQTQTTETPKISGKTSTTSGTTSASTGDIKVKKPAKADMSEFQKKYSDARKKYKAGGATKFSFKGRQYSVATKSELEKAGGYGKVDSYLKGKQAKSKSSGGVIKKSVGGTVRGMGAATKGGSFRVR